MQDTKTKLLLLMSNDEPHVSCVLIKITYSVNFKGFKVLVSF